MGALQLIESRNFRNIECDFFSNQDGNEVWMTRRQVGEALGYAQPNNAIKKIHSRNENRFRNKSRVAQIDTPSGGKQGTTIYNRKGIMEICRHSRKDKADKFMDWVWNVIDEIMRSGAYSMKQGNEFDLMRMMVDKLEETNQRAKRAEQEANQAKNEIAAAKDELKTTKYRVDNLDAVNLDGDLRQRLNQMVRKYAYQNGNDFRKAWNDFKKNFNTAYKTNIELLKTNYQKETGREVSTPEILEIKDKLEDAIRVADKMLN